MMKPGYLYVLVHPSDAGLFKIGVTIGHPEKRLAQHNSQYGEYAGKIVKETGQKWQLKTFIVVPDVYWAESVFWSATGLTEVPYRAGIEVQRLDWSSVQAGLDAAQRAQMRPPPPKPEWVFAYNTWMYNRLKGRGITLLGDVRSKFGKSDFQCSNGHQWRTKPIDVAEGAGCPQCGMGARKPEEIRQAVGASILCLLVHPDQPGYIKIGLTTEELEQWNERTFGDGWEVHRYRRVDQPVLAEKLIWHLLGRTVSDDPKPIALDLRRAEQAFRELHSRMQHELALVERTKVDRRRD